MPEKLLVNSLVTFMTRVTIFTFICPFMCTICEVKDLKETSLGRARELLTKVMGVERYAPLTVTVAHSVQARLVSMCLVLGEPVASGRLDMKIRQNVSTDDVNFALPTVCSFLCSICEETNIEKTGVVSVMELITVLALVNGPVTVIEASPVLARLIDDATILDLFKSESLVIKIRLNVSMTLKLSSRKNMVEVITSNL